METIVEMKQQAQDLIDQACRRGYKAGQMLAENRENDLIEYGRNEAWEAARKIMSQNDDSWNMKDMKEMFGLSYSTDIMLDLSASEVIEKLKVWEKKQERRKDGNISIGDEVYFGDNSPYVVTNINIYANERWANGIDKNGEYHIRILKELRKTGRTFPEIARLLAKIKEGEGE